MIRFERLAIEGFKSFQKDQVFTFPGKPDGFYLITGDNVLEPELGANGAGKSALLAALCYLFFGKDPRGLRGKEIANRTGEHLTSICGEFTLDNESYGLTRTWNPITLTIDLPEKTKPTVIQQDELEALIGCNYESFLSTVLIGQFNLTFFDLPPAEKMAAISAILELDVWEQATTRGKTALRGLESKKNMEQNELSRLSGELHILQEQILFHETASAKFESGREEDKSETEAQLARAKKEAGQHLDAEADLDMKLQAIEQKQAAREEKGESLAKKQEKAQALHQEVIHAKKVFQERLQYLGARKEKLDKIKSTCPTCEQEIPNKHRGKLFELIHDEEGDIKKELAGVVLEEEGALGKLREIEQLQRELKNELVVYFDAKAEVEAKKLRIAEKLGISQERIKNLDRQLNSIDTKANPHTAQIAAMEKDAKKAQAAVDKQKATLKVLAQEVVDTEFWISSFKDIRLWIIKQAITELEFHVNNNLEELGLWGYKIRFDIERAKQDGSGVMKGFHVFVTSPHSDDPIAWESWSGGETQRLRLAGTLGLSDMICERSGFQPSCEFWDEPTTHLSQEGIGDLLALLAARARLRKRQVFLVDHRSLDAGDFDDQIVIRKDEDGSHILQRQPKTNKQRVQKRNMGSPVPTSKI